MLDESGDISVAETTEAIDEVASLNPAMAAPARVEPSPVAATEKTSAEIVATEINLDPADDALKNNAQKIYNELMGRLDESATPMTAQGMAQKEEEREAKKNDAIQAFEDQSKRSEAHREFMNKDHDFGGMKMSGADLSKLIDFYHSDPQIMDKLKDKMVKSGMSKEKADKVAKDFDETIKLQKKERDEGLTSAEQARLLQLSKDKDVNNLAKEFIQLAQENGIQLTLNHKQNFKTAQSAGSMIERSKAEEETIKAHHINSTVSIAAVTNDFEEMSSAALAKTHFASAPDLKDEFSSSANKKLVASNDIGADFAANAPAAVIAQAQTKPKLAALDTSFG